MSDAVIKAGERVMLIDAKDRQYLVTLKPGSAFHTHAGILQHDDVIGVSAKVPWCARARNGVS